MKNSSRFVGFLALLLVSMLVLSACSGGNARKTETPLEGEVENPLGPTLIATDVITASVEGVIDSIDGDFWMISGDKVYVDPGILGDDTFEIGDEVKIEGSLNNDNTITAITVDLVKPGNPSNPITTATP